MEISFSRSACTILFEENDKFYGKEIRVEGEYVPTRPSGEAGFDFNRSSMQWVVGSCLEKIDEETKDILIAYITRKDFSPDFSFKLWS